MESLEGFEGGRRRKVWVNRGEEEGGKRGKSSGEGVCVYIISLQTLLTALFVLSWTATKIVSSGLSEMGLFLQPPGEKILLCSRLAGGLVS